MVKTAIVRVFPSQQVTTVALKGLDNRTSAKAEVAGKKKVFPLIQSSPADLCHVFYNQVEGLAGVSELPFSDSFLP